MLIWNHILSQLAELLFDLKRFDNHSINLHTLYYSGNWMGKYIHAHTYINKLIHMIVCIYVCSNILRAHYLSHRSSLASYNMTAQKIPPKINFEFKI